MPEMMVVSEAIRRFETIQQKQDEIDRLYGQLDALMERMTKEQVRTYYRKAAKVFVSRKGNGD
jgi:hypothetical protein